MLVCLRMIKDETNGFGYEKTDNVSNEDLRNRRISRLSLAQATVDGTISAIQTRIKADNHETLDAVVVGHKDALKSIGPTWNIELANTRLGLNYEEIKGWMTICAEDTFFILRADDEKKFKRLESFLADGIDTLRKLAAAEAEAEIESEAEAA